MIRQLSDRIPKIDAYLLLMNPEHGMPMDLVSRILCYQLALDLVFELKADDDYYENYLTVELSEIALNNSTIFRNKTVVNVQMYMELWDFLQLYCILYINSEMFINNYFSYAT